MEIKSTLLTLNYVRAGRLLLLALLEAPSLDEVLARVALVGLGAAGLAHLPRHVLTHLTPGVSADLAKTHNIYQQFICRNSIDGPWGHIVCPILWRPS